ADLPGRRVRGHDLGAQPDRRRDDALPVGAGHEHPELVGQRHELGLHPLALLPRLAVAGGRDEGGPDALLGAGPEQVRVGGGRGADEDEVELAVGQVVDRGDDRHAEDLAGFARRAVEGALVPRGEDVVQADEAELAGMGGHAGDDDAAGLEQGPEGLHRMTGHEATSTRASTGVGTPSTTMSGFRSADTIDGSASAARDRPSSTAASASRSTGGSPRNSRRSFCVARSSIISAASISVIGTSRKATSATASARMPPTPSMTVMPNCSSRCSPAISSRLPRSIGATSRCTSPSSGRAAARSSSAAAATDAASLSPSRTRPRSVLWAIPSPPSFTTTGNPIASAA